MRGKLSQIRIVEKQKLFKSAWVAKDNELKGGGRKARGRRSGVRLYKSFDCLFFVVLH